MEGKDKCRILKQIRREIAEANGIPLSMPECTNRGPCEGTCPRCEEEMYVLRRSLEELARKGRRVVIPDIPLPVLEQTGSLQEFRLLESRVDELTDTARGECMGFLSGPMD